MTLLYETAGPPNPDSPAEDGKLKSTTMIKESRHYYLDMKENQRGRFLRVRRFVVCMIQLLTVAKLAALVSFRATSFICIQAMQN